MKIMTDNEIIKALKKLYDEAHKGYMANLEHNGPKDTSHEEYIDLMSATLDLIQRQQERIERLKDNLDAVLKERADHTEAIEKFAEKIVEQLESERRFYNSASEHDQLIRQGVSIAFEIVKGVQNE